MKTKRLLSICLAFCMLLTLLPSAFAEQIEETELVLPAEASAAEDVKLDTVQEAYTVTFLTDGNCSVTAFDTQDTTSGTEDAAFAFARSSDTGEIDLTGDGQVNFMVVVDDGYTLSSVTAEPANYKNLKTVDASTNLYRLTKITGDVSVTIVTEQKSEQTESEEGDGVIHLNETAIDASGVSGVTVNGTTVTITAAGTYYLEGTLTDGQIAVAATAKTDEVVLNLTDVTVTCSTGNALNATLGAVTLANTSGSTSTFISTATDGVGIYSKNDLTIKGADAATKIIAKSTSGNGIRCKADLEIGLGDVEVEAGNHGIKGDESVKFTKKAGTIKVTAVGDAIKTDAIDSDTLELDTDSSYNPKGTITVNGGTFDLTAGGDGFQADYGFVCANSPVIVINSGTEGIKANTTPVDAWYYADAAQTLATVQGFVQIDGGSITITTSEDGIKAADYVNITGGTISITATLDGIQSGVDYLDAYQNTVYTNGNVTISGGTISITTNGGANGTSTENSCKGIKAIDALTISGGSFTLNCYDDAIHSNYTVTITGGDFEIATADDGVHADYYLTLGTESGTDADFTMNITTAYEALEGSVISYLSGTTTLYATDDGVNAAGDYEENGTYHASTTTSTTTTQSTFGPGGGGRPGNPGGGNFGPGQGMDDTSDYGMLYIKGGKLYVVANGDGLDSNGSILMSGGIVVVNGTTSGGNGVFDIGDTSGCYFRVTGGTLVGFGTSDMRVVPTVSGQSYLNTTTSISRGSTKIVRLATDLYLGIIPERTLSSAFFFVTDPSMSSAALYNGSVSFTEANRVLGRTQSSTWYGILRSDYDNTETETEPETPTDTQTVFFSNIKTDAAQCIAAYYDENGAMLKAAQATRTGTYAILYIDNDLYEQIKTIKLFSLSSDYTPVDAARQMVLS